MDTVQRDARTAPAGAPGVAAPQTVRMVTGAEIRRHLRRGGMRGGIITAVVLGAGIGLLMIVIDNAMDAESTLFPVISVGTGAGLAAFVLAVAAVFRVGRDGQGQIALALTLVPDRRRLYLARAAGFGSVGAVSCAAVAVLLSMIAMLLHPGEPEVRWSLLGIPLAFCGGALVVLFAFGLTSLVRRSSAGILLFLGVVVILPLGFFAMGFWLPESIAPAAEVLAMNTPLSHLAEAFDASSVPNPEAGAGDILAGMTGLLAWGVLPTLAAWPIFDRGEAR